MVTFPGLSELAKFKEWYDHTLNPINSCCNIVWAVFNTVSLIVSVLGIYFMMKTMQQLKRYDPRLKTNFFQLILHVIVLTINLGTVIIDCLPFSWFNQK